VCGMAILPRFPTAIIVRPRQRIEVSESYRR
jgi:hypothetical protein